ncbi:LPXTG cell wall anchor domain-containing protein [Mesorhizobium sp. B2-2-2]|nr:LPXTG cell wall anchor domain-containing protein [Mesorhizobium sp. B2-2-2]
MTGQSQWLTIGIVVMLLGLAGLVWANRSRS